MKTFDLMISDMSDLIPTLVLHIHDNTKTLPFQFEASENKFQCVTKLTIKWHSSLSIYD